MPSKITARKGTLRLGKKKEKKRIRQKEKKMGKKGNEKIMSGWFQILGCCVKLKLLIYCPLLYFKCSINFFGSIFHILVVKQWIKSSLSVDSQYHDLITCLTNRMKQHFF